MEKPGHRLQQGRGGEVTKKVARHGAHRLRRHARELWESRGGGFYGFVATVTFLCLEAVNLVGDVSALPHLQLGLGGLISWLVQNFVQGLMTALWAAIWPVAWISRLGVGVTSGILFAASYGVYRLIRPTVTRWLREPGEAEGA
jgi:hypothetical protein